MILTSSQTVSSYVFPLYHHHHSVCHVSSISVNSNLSGEFSNALGNNCLSWGAGNPELLLSHLEKWRPPLGNSSGAPSPSARRTAASSVCQELTCASSHCSGYNCSGYISVHGTCLPPYVALAFCFFEWCTILPFTLAWGTMILGDVRQRAAGGRMKTQNPVPGLTCWCRFWWGVLKTFFGR